MLNLIPIQLKKPEFRFVKLKEKEKIPFENNWQNKGYQYDDINLRQHKGNIGVIGGYGNLRIIDCDNEKFAQEILNVLPRTLTVKTGSGGYHLYFISDYDKNHVFVNGLGELRAKNYQCVIPPSVHPNGKQYKIHIDDNITKIPGTDIVRIIKPYIRQTLATPTVQKSDSSRSATEYRYVCRLLKQGKSKQEVWKEMQAFSKWNTAPEQYREITYAKAQSFVEGQIKNVQVIEKPPTQFEITFLKERDLLEIIGREFDKKIEGEINNRIAIFLNACGRYVMNHNLASYNLCINSNSGAGKDYIAKNILNIFPSQMVVKRSRISPAVFTYWHNTSFEPEWSWDGKILLLSDISNQVLNSEVFKLMCSDETYSTIVINQKAVDIEIIGKPIIFVTTASANPNNEMLRRMPSLDLDESIDQTKAIKKRQANYARKGIALKYNENITQALSKLSRVKVKIAFASDIVDHYPNDHIIMRTHFSRLLDYIKASAALFQYQRKKDDDGYILAETQDYDNATIVLRATTSNPMMIPLTKKQKMLLEECKRLKSFSVKELEPHIPFLVQSKIYDAVAKLQEYGFLTSSIIESEHNNRPVRHYTYQEFTIKKIPLWKDIQKGNEGKLGN